MISSIPNRRELRKSLRPYETKNNALAIKLFLIDYSLFFIAEYGVVVLPIALKLFASFIVVIAVTRLFLLGHDACHGSLTDSKKMNKWLGHIAFLPTLTTFRSWAHGHNTIHHSSTTFASDDMWSPLSVEDYQNLSQFQKLRYRIYRSFFGGGFYYLGLWWSYLYFPSEKLIGKDAAKRFLSDSILVTGFLIVWVMSLYALAVVTSQDYLPLLLLGFVLPFMGWNMIMGFLIYVHHTHPDVHWYKDRVSWLASQPHVFATVHIRFPKLVSTGLHHIMEHHAHHLSMNIPCYNLKAAQRKLEETLPEHFVVQDFSWKWYLECTRVCKLYDFEKHEWVGFESIVKEGN
jgi:omega-6 fatty acid desaturase (delta-12 desaturase)